ncbi:MAG: extracellular solute-binding protein [Clostridiaceae bacterium]|nr:extracellular solute-binding protein [Clostridiaceae bacterium]
MVKAKRFVDVILIFIIMNGLISCSQGSSKYSTAFTPKKQVNLKFFSNLPDRLTGQGKLEQMLLDKYVKENPNVKITVEALQDEPYKQKFKTYVASNEIPDVFMAWGQPSFFYPIMINGYVVELNKEDFKDYGFFNGALDGFSLNGRLYGLPRNTDYMVLYFNKAIFEKYKVPLPKTYEDIISSAKIFRANNLSPIAMNGKDKYPIAILYQDLLIKESGDQRLIGEGLRGTNKFASNGLYLKAALDLKALMDVKGFQDSFDSADYGAANNLFAQGKAAMYYMGEWEVGMDTSKGFSEDFKKNVDVMKFPATSTGKGKDTDLVGWNGGGYAVSANSKVIDESIKLLKYIMKPENWAKQGWQTVGIIPAQEFHQFKTGKESPLQSKLSDILASSTSISGTPWNDSLTYEFKTNIENLVQEFSLGIKSPEEFLKEAEINAANSY